MKNQGNGVYPWFHLGGVGEVAYKRRSTGEGSTFRNRKKTRVRFSACGLTVAASYLKVDMASSHGICIPQKRGINEVVGGSTTYMVSFPRVLHEVIFPVPG